MSYPVISIVSPGAARLSIGLCKPGNFWGDRELLVERRYLLNISFSSMLDLRAITVIIGPLYLQLGWRVR